MLLRKHDQRKNNVLLKRNMKRRNTYFNHIYQETVRYIFLYIFLNLFSELRIEIENIV